MVTFRRAIVLIATMLLGLTFFTAPAHAGTRDGLGGIEATRLYVHPSRQGWCLDLAVPVASEPGGPRRWNVAASYCQPFRLVREVDVLTHGATYTRAYWDWPGFNGKYSYVARALADGRATLSYDRIGNGASTRQADGSAEITMASDAFVLQQLIQLVKLTGIRQVNSIGHSYGSGVVLAQAKEYGNVSTVVLTGYLHRPSNPLVTAGNYPANGDPKFQDVGLDGGWLTTRPGARLYGFHAADSDPVLVSQDEDRKDVVSRTGLLSFLSDRGVPAGDNISNLITAPVLVVNGSRDAIFCLDPATFDCVTQAAANEAPFYTKAKNFKVVTILESGHDLTLHPTAGDSYQEISQWVRSH